MKWINVKDELPKDNKEYMTIDKYSYKTFARWYESVIRWRGRSGETIKPTHWMPLPKPPEETDYLTDGQDEFIRYVET